MIRERTIGVLDFSHDFLFCLNIALLVRLISVNHSLSSFEPNLKFRVNSALDLNSNSYVGGYIAFFVLAAVLAVVLCALLWILMSFVSSVFRLYYGFLSLIALPLIWLVTSSIHRILPGLANPPHIWLFLELVAVVACSVLFFVRQWPFPAWASVALVAVHFVLWGWLLTGGIYFWLAPAKLIFPLASFASCIAWGIYLARRQFPSATPAERRS